MEDKKAVVERFVFPVYQRTAANPYAMPAVAVILNSRRLGSEGSETKSRGNR